MLHVEITESWLQERILVNWKLSFEMVMRRARVFRLKCRMTSLTWESTSISSTGTFTMEVGIKRQDRCTISNTIPWLCGKLKWISLHIAQPVDSVFQQSILTPSNRWWSLYIGFTHTIIYVAYWKELIHRVKTALTSTTTPFLYSKSRRLQMSMDAARRNWVFIKTSTISIVQVLEVKRRMYTTTGQDG